MDGAVARVRAALLPPHRLLPPASRSLKAATRLPINVLAGSSLPPPAESDILRASELGE